MNVGFETKTINGKKYGINLLPARKAFMYGLELRKLMPAGGSFLDAQATDALDGMKFQTIAQAVMDNFDSLDVEMLLDSIVFDNLVCNGQDIPNIDIHFQADLGEMLDVIIWAMEVNFSSLFTGSTYLSKILSKLKNLGFLPKERVQEEESTQEEVLASE